MTGTLHMQHFSHAPNGRWSPKALLDICTVSVLRNVENYTKIVLPEELTLHLLSLLIEAKKLNQHTLLPFLHSSLRNLNLRYARDKFLLLLFTIIFPKKKM